MNNNTKVRVHLSKQLFEALSREVLMEAKKGSKKVSENHAMKLTSKMPRLGENKEMIKAKKKKVDETKKKVMEVAKAQLSELMKKKKS